MLFPVGFYRIRLTRSIYERDSSFQSLSEFYEQNLDIRKSMLQLIKLLLRSDSCPAPQISILFERKYFNLVDSLHASFSLSKSPTHRFKDDYEIHSLDYCARVFSVFFCLFTVRNLLDYSRSLHQHDYSFHYLMWLWNKSCFTQLCISAVKFTETGLAIPSSFFVTCWMNLQVYDNK